MNTFHLLELENFPILEQLRIEEALLRSDSENWCIINKGTPPAVVMGISGKPHKLVNLDALAEAEIPLIKRFSGGGTIVADEDTVFLTLLGNRSVLPFTATPPALMCWTHKLYKSAFPGLDFRLIENDYTIGNKKIGGNAQYLRKDRWLHHSSFLWNFQKERMQILTLPEKRPDYREARSHKDFLDMLNNYLPSKEQLISNLKKALEQSFTLIPESLDSIQEILHSPHRKTTVIVNPTQEYATTSS